MKLRARIQSSFSIAVLVRLWRNQLSVRLCHHFRVSRVSLSVSLDPQSHTRKHLHSNFTFSRSSSNLQLVALNTDALDRFQCLHQRNRAQLFVKRVNCLSFSLGLAGKCWCTLCTYTSVDGRTTSQQRRYRLSFHCAYVVSKYRARRFRGRVRRGMSWFCFCFGGRERERERGSCTSFSWSITMIDIVSFHFNRFYFVSFLDRF